MDRSEVDPRHLEKDEIARLLAHAGPHLRPILITALHTGMRRGEISNLQWRDIELKQRTLYVRESKNGEGRRLPISDELRATLMNLPSRTRGNGCSQALCRLVAMVVGTAPSWT